jgi:hypothetical protein
VILVFTFRAAPAAEPLTVYRNDKGQITGYGERRGNTTTFENSLGQNVGRAEQRRDGTVQFYDAQGRQTGSARKAR